MTLFVSPSIRRVRYKRLLSIIGACFLMATINAPVLKAGEQDVSEAAAGDPLGAFDEMRIAPDGVTVRGWALDQGSQGPLEIAVYLEGVFLGIGLADDYRPDVAAKFPATGINHGFHLYVPTGYTTNGNLCLYAINDTSTAGSNTLLECKEMSLPTAPFGSLDSVSMAPVFVKDPKDSKKFIETVGAWLDGWTINPKSEDPITVHNYVDGKILKTTDGDVSIDADEYRDDIDAAFPNFGGSHGFSRSIYLDAGEHTICAYGIASGNNSNLGCKSITVSNNSLSSLDMVSRIPGGIRAQGWVLDPDTADSVLLHLYEDGIFIGEVYAEDERLDVENSFPFYGPYHGFDVTFVADLLPHNVCIYSIAAGMGSNSLVGCRTL